MTNTNSHGRLVGFFVISLTFTTFVGCSHLPRLASRRSATEGRNLAAGQTAEIQVALGRSFEADGDFDKALAAYREAAQTAPKRAEPQLRMAILLDRLGRFAEAAPHYEAALKASPADAEIYSDRGYSLCLQGRDAEGETALRQAIALKPDLARAHNNLAALLGRTGRSEEALAEFRKAGCPEPDAHLNLAFALGQARRWNEAKKHVELAKGFTQKSPGIGEDVARLESLIARAEVARPAAVGEGVGAPSDSDLMTVGGGLPRPGSVNR